MMRSTPLKTLTAEIFGVQFHPEVAHTPLGAQVLRNFLFSICKCRGDWSPKAVIQEQVERIREQWVKPDTWFAVSRAASTPRWPQRSCIEAIGDRQTCIFVDNGLLREGEFESTLALLDQRMNLNMRGVRAGDQFLGALSGRNRSGREAETNRQSLYRCL